MIDNRGQLTAGDFLPLLERVPIFIMPLENINPGEPHAAELMVTTDDCDIDDLHRARWCPADHVDIADVTAVAVVAG